jgi:hypothetical protein
LSTETPFFNLMGSHTILTTRKSYEEEISNDPPT